MKEFVDPPGTMSGDFYLSDAAKVDIYVIIQVFERGVFCSPRMHLFDQNKKINMK